jgi:predicted metal-dependent phosphotriesterase family hydrolase
LILASGHILAKEALLLFSEARKAGVKHMIATHAMDLTGKMTVAEMKEAAALGAVIEFDFRNIFDDNAVRADAIRAVGPEHCLISEFWTKNNPREYGAPEGTYAFITNMRKKSFTDRELDIMFKDNPAKLLDLPTP